jgi:hypothetical protein
MRKEAHRWVFVCLPVLVCGLAVPSRGGAYP